MNTRNSNIRKNYLYNLFYQMFLIIVPILVTPYIARILGEDGSGQYSFSYSILTYFNLFAALGFNTYGQREIAKNQGNIQKQSITFWEIIIARIIPVFLSLTLLYILIFAGVFDQIYSLLLIIMSMQIFFVGFDIAFLFQGNEQFGKIVLRNFIIKTIGIISIFLFVKNRSDVWIYTLIQSLIVVVSNLSLWGYLRKYLCKVKISELNPLKHLIPTLILFLPTIATSIYTSLDKTLIGVMVDGTITEILSDGSIIVKNISDIENGNYEYAEKLVKMAMTIITSLGIVMVPNNTKLFSEGKLDEVNVNIYKSIRYVFLVGLPMTFGLILISNVFLPWYLGDGYDKAITLLRILSPLVLIIGISNIFGLQYLIPTGQDKKYTIAITSGAIINVILNLILIPLLKSYGAAIGTIAAEMTVTIIMYCMIRKTIHLKKIFLFTWKYLVASVIMFFALIFFTIRCPSGILNTILITFVGVLIYLIALLIMQDDLLFTIIKNIKIMIKKFWLKIYKKNRSDKNKL